MLVKREILNANKKEELTNWWLGIIRQRVDKLLRDYNYDFDAVPNDYIDNPPSSLAQVKENLSVVQLCLRSFNTYQQREASAGREKDLLLTDREKELQAAMLELLANLKNDIYPKLDEFVIQAQTALLDHFDCLDVPFDVTMVVSLLKLTREDMDPTTTQSIERIIGEIRYVEQMKILENSTVKIDNKDIVPITGLTVGRFVRLENELQTVLEVWTNAIPKIQPPGKSDETS